MAGITTIGAVAPDYEPSLSSDGDQKVHILRATYSFAEHGGTGIIGLGVFLPDNAVITRSWYEVTTQITSVGAGEIAWSVISDDVSGILGPANMAANGGVGFHEGIQTGTAANFSTKTTAAREITMDVTVADLDAGFAVLFCEYVVTA